MNGASFAAAARGPVLMIAVGALFAADHAGSVSIGRTWPILLIVFGAMRLWEYLGAKQA
jgi:LiaI-LiaF-like transmembrane region